MKAMESIHDLIEEAKLRTVWWILCVFVVTYFLTHTSKSMLMNVPVALLLVAGARILVNEVEFRKKITKPSSTSYLSHLEKKQLSVDDSRLTTVPPPAKWKRKIDSPVVEAALEDFINSILRDFVVDLWYSEITPDREAPELIHAIIMDVLGEVAGRLKELNLVDLLTKDAVDLVGDHLDLFRRNQAAIGVDVMKTLSSEERDERLKHHLLSSKELHPALISPDCEYKVLQRLMGGVIAVVLRPREAQCPLVRSIARELLTCLVMQPVMNFATPTYINELIECIILAYHNEGSKDGSTDQSPNEKDNNPGCTVSGGHGQSNESNSRKVTSSNNQETDLHLSRSEYKKDSEASVSVNPFSSTMQNEPMHPRSADWAKAIEAATQRRSEVLMPENLENMWTIGRNYKKKLQKKGAPGLQAQITKSGSATLPREDLMKSVKSVGTLDKTSMHLPPLPQQDTRPTSLSMDTIKSSVDYNKDLFPKRGLTVYELDSESSTVYENRNKIRRSNSTSDLKLQTNPDEMFAVKDTTAIINEYYSADRSRPNANKLKSSSDVVIRTEGMQSPKLRCRVLGASYERTGSKSFAVYSIAVSDADNNTWFVKRRYSNFERLHRHLKDIPNYTLHLPPKRIFSSSTEDAFVYQRSIQLEKYLQDLLSIANVAEQHEVWDFFSDSSKNYSSGKSSSVMRTLAVNVDDAVDDIVRQFKGVSDGLIRAVAAAPSYGLDSSITSRNLNWDTDELSKLVIRQSTSESINSYSDTDDGDKYTTNGRDDSMSASQAEGWRSDNELDSKVNPTSVVKHDENIPNLDTEDVYSSRLKSESISRVPESILALTTVPQVDLTGIPPEWTPPNLSVPVLNLVDNIFQLKRRGWLRRQVFWISKQILQLVMEDAIDDWLLRQIQLLRREDVVAYGIRWVHDVLWPGGTFFIRLRTQDQSDIAQANQSPQHTAGQPSGRKGTQPGSFEEQLEATRRASYVKKMIFNGAPATLVSLIGHKQYRRCARDINYFLQSTVCLKQLGYGILELVLISVFPELRDLVRDIHEKAQMQSV